jgi:uncharacterized protein YwqG
MKRPLSGESLIAIVPEQTLHSFQYTLMAMAVIFGLFMLVTSLRRRRRMLRAPRITMEELDAFQTRLDAASLPMVRIFLIPDAVAGATSSRMGGQPYVDGPKRKWPMRGKDRHPMLFVAQINFAEMPPIEDFPRMGLLQLFALADKHGQLQGTDRKADRVIRWFPAPAGNLTLTPPEALTSLHKRGTFSQRTVRDGLGMRFETGKAAAHPNNWPYNAELPNAFMRLPESDAVKQRLTEWEKEIEARIDKNVGWHWIGGHPQFVQVDVREEPRLRKLNRVLLHLSSDDTDIYLGDAGELNLLISRKDLRHAAFDQSFCTWDCS